MAGRVSFDQLFGSPMVIAMVFISTSILHGDIVSCAYRFREAFFITWVNGLKYWPIVHCITFGVIPLKHQPLFAHFASLYWNAVLSYYANQSIEVTSK